MAQAHVEAVLEAAVDGISFDGLVVEATGETYRFETPTESHEDVPENELRGLCRDSAYVTNWYFWHARAPQSESDWAFLRWLDGIDEADVTESCERVDVLDRYEALRDGIDRTWGELAVTTTLATNGKRRYHLRHVDDTDVSTDTLEVCREREALRELVRFDQQGRYRPLKSAPTLQTGWHAPDCSAGQLLDLLSVVYPASVENWYRDRTDTLDVVHWREAMSRQTGIYGVIETWDRGEGHEHVEWVTEACCVDSQCLKRRHWHYDEETPLDTDPGEGKIPCREPCSLVIAGARTWTRLEGEQPRTYEFELTPSEKEQLEAIVEAVSDGRVDRIREADFSDDANRYRARFLRAKRFDEDGNLCGVPTGRDEE